jgi:hypothetical protein
MLTLFQNWQEGLGLSSLSGLIYQDLLEIEGFQPLVKSSDTCGTDNLSIFQYFPLSLTFKIFERVFIPLIQETFLFFPDE